MRPKSSFGSYWAGHDFYQCVAVARKTALWEGTRGILYARVLRDLMLALRDSRFAGRRRGSPVVRNLSLAGGQAPSKLNRFAATAFNQTSGAFDVGFVAIAEAPSSQARRAVQVKVSQP